ncbi:SDR family NAD(P)-dependent oxidoreductase [Alkalihalobacillus sp. 1P02AB]|uniref:SDR family NAD(P)-dependent oxidoreductase n=1 Tax=Alkalihalobacillus sp. 1P02AB TaxID=3132260 RepID=UPI0039A70259
MEIKNKVFVVTGGGSGIGRELVLNLLSKGAQVAAVDLNKNGLEETVQLAGEKKDKVSTHVVNITDREAVEALPEQVMAYHGAVDALINNAGIIQPFVHVNDLDYEKIKLVMDVNFYGTLYMVKTFLPHLLKRPVAHITNISSMGGFLPVPGQSIYGASKAAVKLMTEGLHSELKDTNVNVTVVFPGGVGTDITKNSGADTGERKEATAEQKKKLLTPQDAAEIIIKGTENNQYRVLAGKDSKLLDFIYRMNPKKAASLIAEKLK